MLWYASDSIRWHGWVSKHPLYLDRWILKIIYFRDEYVKNDEISSGCLKVFEGVFPGEGIHGWVRTIIEGKSIDPVAVSKNLIWDKSFHYVKIKFPLHKSRCYIIVTYERFSTSIEAGVKAIQILPWRPARTACHYTIRVTKTTYLKREMHDFVVTWRKIRIVTINSFHWRKPHVLRSI